MKIEMATFSVCMKEVTSEARCIWWDPITACASKCFWMFHILFQISKFVCYYVCYNNANNFTQLPSIFRYDGNILWRNVFRLYAMWWFRTLNFVHWSQIYIQSKTTTRNKNVTECFTFTLVREVMLIESWWFHALGSHFKRSKVTNITTTNIQLHLWHGLVITKLGTYKKRNHTWGKNPTP